MASNFLTTKSGRKLGKKTLQMGFIAAVGALAYAAYQRYTTGSPASSNVAAIVPEATIKPAPERSAFLPAKDDAAGKENLALILFRAMIAAARSDGRLDAQESQAIFQRIESLGLAPEEQAMLVAKMGRPVDMDAIVNSASCLETAAEIYLASILAVDIDTPAEKSYLAMLAARFKLPPDLVTELHRQVDAERSV